MDLVLVQPYLQVRGGLENVLLHIAKKYNPTIYTYLYSPENTFPEFKEFDIRVVKPHLTRITNFLKDGGFKWSIQSGDAFWNLKIQEDYDVINAHGVPSEWARNKNPRMLWYCHTPNRAAFDLYDWVMAKRSFYSKPLFWASVQWFKFFEYRVVPKIESIVTNSKNSQSRIKKYLNRDADIIYPGIDPSIYSNNSYDKYFFYPSRITPEKRFEYAIEAFKKSGLASKGFKLIIAGSLQNIPNYLAYYEKLKSLISGYGEIHTNVPYPQLLDLYSSAYSVLFTPVDEDFGLIPLEAMASGKPVLAVNEGGPRETVVDGETGYLVNSVDELAQRMIELAENPDLVERMGRAGRKRVLSNFTWDVFFRKFDAKLKEVGKL